uniref:Probable RNA-binding protein EIF1AD n=1 Tax=Ficedula albicollis TaxID=59894 RepID=A0A803VFX2_FICAL
GQGQQGPGAASPQVLGTPGNNLHEVETAEGTRFLASMPPRFRRHIWIKRGDFLLVDPILEGSKVKAEISLVLLPPHVRSLQLSPKYPKIPQNHQKTLKNSQKHPKYPKVSPKYPITTPKPPKNTQNRPKIPQNHPKLPRNTPKPSLNTQKPSLNTQKYPKTILKHPKTIPK